MSKWEIKSLALSCESAARMYESNWCVVGQVADFAKISTLAELIVESPVLLITMRAVHQIKKCKTHLRAAAWGALYCDRSPQVGSLRDWSINSSGHARGCRLCNDVKQHLADFACASAYGISLFILEGINPSIDVEG